VGLRCLKSDASSASSQVNRQTRRRHGGVSPAPRWCVAGAIKGQTTVHLVDFAPLGWVFVTCVVGTKPRKNTELQSRKVIASQNVMPAFTVTSRRVGSTGARRGLLQLSPAPRRARGPKHRTKDCCKRPRLSLSPATVSHTASRPRGASPRWWLGTAVSVNSVGVLLRGDGSRGARRG
jgi:hypothetical protein